MASDSLAKFSELLRYQLYECNDKQIPLQNEIDYLENFIELEKLRQNDNIKVKLLLDQPLPGHLGIAPFILMTFVENAFKHVSKDSDKQNRITIQIRVDQQELDFSISNSTSQNKAHDVVHYGGIGLKNVKRRLDLIYPGQYDLDIQKTETRFIIKLKLQLIRLAIQPVLQELPVEPPDYQMTKVSTV